MVCGDGNAMHQFLHVDDAALCFAHVLGKPHCIGQVYNMVKMGFTSWSEYHRAVMRILGQEVDMVVVPLEVIKAAQVPQSSICENIFAHNTVYSPGKLYRDVPEFRPRISLEEGIQRVLAALDRQCRIPDSDSIEWEDRLIRAHRDFIRACAP